MSSSSKAASKKPHLAEQKAFPKERGAFKALLLTNPNYFGNLNNAAFEPVLPIQQSTFYEELGCLGYHPQQERLEAVVYVYQPTGYGSGICGQGTPEYVRFYLSYDNGATWQDQGIAGFQAYDIPQGTQGPKRLEYAVSLAVNPLRKFCLSDPLIKARAILSWNNPPPPNQPHWIPIWGNVREVNILVEPFRLIPVLDILDLAKVELSPSLKSALDLSTPVPTKLNNLGAVELAALYKGKDIPVHRFAFKEISGFLQGTTSLNAEALTAVLPGIQIKPDILDILFPQTDGNTSFEELTCIGLDPNQPDTLVGVIHVKKPSGYSGNPCSQGSTEYVTFWGDFNGNGTFETCLGTASVQVYDVTKIPDDGVHYAVRLPVDLNPYRKPCTEGPRLVRIRAILSWNQPVACADSNKVPTWGNREETVIHIASGTSSPTGKIAILGGIPVGKIDNFSGLTTPTAVFATNNFPPDSLGRPCPFAGRVTVQGAPILGHTYVVEVSTNGVSWEKVLTDLWVTDQNGNLSLHQANPATQRFSYLPFQQNVNSVLAQWDSSGDALSFVRLSVFDAASNLVGVDVHRIQLDNTWPQATIDITSGAGNCGKFSAGVTISGTFVATDTYLGSYSLGVEPAVNPPGVGVPTPSSGLSNTAPAPGNAWSLNTTGMKPCGYVVRVVATDRAIVNSQSVGHQSASSVGLCLE
ncbi:MAG: hypothetical protein JNK85_03480 [Verrucomicrobiales bacterium]|nr:hypothetical protein [Verrucomicrobiales bacterium]